MCSQYKVLYVEEKPQEIANKAYPVLCNESRNTMF